MYYITLNTSEPTPRMRRLRQPLADDVYLYGSLVRFTPRAMLV